jgi:hypothetical protein
MRRTHYQNALSPKANSKGILRITEPPNAHSKQEMPKQKAKTTKAKAKAQRFYRGIHGVDPAETVVA